MTGTLKAFSLPSIHRMHTLNYSRFCHVLDKCNSCVEDCACVYCRVSYVTTISKSQLSLATLLYLSFIVPIRRRQRLTSTLDVE